ncbi:MAG: alanyl-tRNA editing protein [Pseudomonadales bacterium]
MSQAMYSEQPYLKTLNTQISAVDGEWIECQQSIFYPLGGGQPGDSGELAGAQLWQILDTRKGEGGAIRHQLSTADHGLVVGDEVTLRLNWPRRHRHMRMHSAMHLLCSLIPRGVTGGSVGELKSRLDFDLGEHSVDKGELTAQLNALIAEDRPLSWRSVDEAELDANPELVRTLSVQPPRGVGAVRLVEIAGVDLQPCGGTHVRSTGEIGELVVNKIENKGKRNRRIHLSLVAPEESDNA